VTQLILVRHGESQGNVAAAVAREAQAEVVQMDVRDADADLSPTGAEQAAALGRGLAALDPGLAPTLVWTSPYVRARRTAELALAAGGLDLPVVVDERLRDRELGILDLLTGRGVRARFPAEADRRRWLGKFYHRPPGGESWADVMLRVRSVLADLRDEGPDERILVVCHDALVLGFRYVCQRLSETEVLDLQATEPVRNVSITRLERGPQDRAWTLLSYNDVSHLEQGDVPVTSHPGERDVHPR
jgi:broad specificity phosphatase PhoE